MKYLVPDLMLENIYGLTLPLLQERGVAGLLFDLDNTITTWNNLDFAPALIHFFAEIQAAGIGCCILSNNSAERIAPVAASLGIQYLARAKKPRRSGYLQACQLLGSLPATTMMVGDQLFTDMLGARRSGLQAVLVRPIDLSVEFFGTRINRCLEKIVLPAVLRNYQRNRQIKEAAQR